MRSPSSQMRRAWFAWMLWVSTAVFGNASAVRAAMPDQLAVIVNRADPLSRAIGDYYVERRGIPLANLIKVEFAPDRDSLAREEFDGLLRDVALRTPEAVQFYALTWARPYRVECMSITSAFAFGFDTTHCADGCRRTRLSPYFGSDTVQPWRDLRMRPTMSIAATSLERAKALIDRGIAADGTRPRGKAYLVRTGDAARDVRAAGYRQTREAMAGQLKVNLEDTPGITGRRDVMFYFTGAVAVPGIETNRYLPGAVADHLTSAGGVLIGSPQMSSLRWLEAGATGSYGTVVEPCNLTGKFPSPGMLMRRYVQGETLIESYWKSVAMPGQGIFIGEPLAAPYAAAARIASGAR